MPHFRTHPAPGRPRLGRLLLAATLLGAASPALAQDPSREGRVSASDHLLPAIERSSEQIRSWMEERSLPGVSVAVGHAGEVVWARGFGVADVEQGVGVTPGTRFRIGSASKGLTSVGVGILLERGSLDLDAPIRAYVPSFPEKRWPITTRQLMAHSAGIRHYLADEPYSSARYGSVQEALTVFAGDSLLFEPGTETAYSTYGWTVVSAVVEAVSGIDFLEFMRTEVLDAADLSETGPDDAFAIVPDRTRFYVRDEGGLRNERFVDQSNKWAGGGFLSTPSDLVRLGLALLEGRLLTEDTIEMLWGPAPGDPDAQPGVGLGWRTATLGGRRLIASPGSSVGGQTAFLIFPDDDLVIAVTSNVTAAELVPIWQGLYRSFRAQLDSPAAPGAGR